MRVPSFLYSMNLATLNVAVVINSVVSVTELSLVHLVTGAVGVDVKHGSMNTFTVKKGGINSKKYNISNSGNCN